MGWRQYKGGEMTESEKPSYLGLLNAIALGEGCGREAFESWAAHTKDPLLRPVLETVAAREGEHAESFAARIRALGFQVQPRELPDLDRLREVLASDQTDLEKLRCLYPESGSAATDRDIFDGLLRDDSMDPETRALVERYVAEERDSARLLRQQLQRLVPPP